MVTTASVSVFAACVALATASPGDKHHDEIKEHYHHLAYIADFPCHVPQPRVLAVDKLFADTHGKAFFPDVTVLHRCDEEAGCCTEGKSCQAAHSYAIDLPFKITFLDDHGKHKKGSWIIEYFKLYNHTECSCGHPEHYQDNQKHYHGSQDHHAGSDAHGHHEENHHHGSQDQHVGSGTHGHQEQSNHHGSQDQHVGSGTHGHQEQSHQHGSEDQHVGSGPVKPVYTQQQTHQGVQPPAPTTEDPDNCVAEYEPEQPAENSVQRSSPTTVDIVDQFAALSN